MILVNNMEVAGIFMPLVEIICEHLIILLVSVWNIGTAGSTASDQVSRVGNYYLIDKKQQSSSENIT